MHYNSTKELGGDTPRWIHQASRRAVPAQQIRGGDPDFVAEAALRLERAGIHPHEVRHLLALPMAHQTFAVTKEGGSYNRDEHRLAIEKILSEHLPRR